MEMQVSDWISLSGQILVFAGLIFAALKFAHEKKREFQKKFFEEQLRIYSEAVDHAAILSVFDKTEEEYRDAKNNFKRLFWGKMCIIEDGKVQGKMEEFHHLLNKYDAENDSLKYDGLKGHLQQASVGLAHACRTSSLNIWEIDNLKGFNDYSTSNSIPRLADNQ